MSKSLKRVKLALAEAGLDVNVLEMQDETRTAEQAAQQAGCALDQIAKSIIFKGEKSDQIYLFLTAGGNRVSTEKASALAQETLGRAEGAFIRAKTGFAIGGVSPVGHLSPVSTFFDPRLEDFDLVWAAAGTPRHIFSITPRDLLRITTATKAVFTEET